MDKLETDHRLENIVTIVKEDLSNPYQDVDPMTFYVYSMPFVNFSRKMLQIHGLTNYDIAQLAFYYEVFPDKTLTMNQLVSLAQDGLKEGGLRQFHKALSNL